MLLRSLADLWTIRITTAIESHIITQDCAAVLAGSLCIASACIQYVCFLHRIDPTSGVREKVALKYGVWLKGLERQTHGPSTGQGVSVGAHHQGRVD